jgi:hypothetical protein
MCFLCEIPKGHKEPQIKLEDGEGRTFLSDNGTEYNILVNKIKILSITGMLQGKYTILSA